MDKRRNCFIVKSADNSTCQGNVPPTERFATNVNKGIITQKIIVCQDERKTQSKKVNVDILYDSGSDELFIRVLETKTLEQKDWMQRIVINKRYVSMKIGHWCSVQCFAIPSFLPTN